MKIIKIILNTLFIAIPLMCIPLAPIYGVGILGIFWVITIALFLKGIMNLLEKKNKNILRISVILICILLFFSAREILRDITSG